MKKSIYIGVLALGLTLIAKAAPVTGWVGIYDGNYTTNTTLIDAATAATASPTLNNDNFAIAAQLGNGGVLADGQTITLSGKFQANWRIENSQFRLGLFNGPATLTEDDGSHTTGGGFAGIVSLAFRDNGRDDLNYHKGLDLKSPFVGGVNGVNKTELVDKFFTSLPSGSFNNQNAVVDFSLSITRDGDLLDITSIFNGSVGTSNTVTGLNILSKVPGFDYTFDTVAIGLGNDSYTKAWLTDVDFNNGIDSGYDIWADSYELTNSAAAKDADPDEDTVDNLTEYALDGNPTNNNDKGMTSEGKFGGQFYFAHAQLVDDSEVEYIVEVTDDLVAGSWTNTGITVTSGTLPSAAYNMTTNSIPMGDNQNFLRLNIIAVP